MLRPYALKNFAEKLNEINMGDNRITPIENFSGTTTYITLKNNHTWGFPVYVLDEILQGNISVLPKWELK